MAARRTNQELFYDMLSYLSGGSLNLVSNNRLRETLNWDVYKYEKTKQELLALGQIDIGKGPGGSVRLTELDEEYESEEDDLKATALNVFISYSHSDEKYRRELVKHLEPLKKRGIIDAWHDRRIKAGEEWEAEISDNLEEAEIILLLISSDFISSDYCTGIELERALEKHEEKSTIVIPVILRPCMWTQMSFSKLQALPTDATPISSSPNMDEAMTDVAEGVRRIAEQLYEQKQRSS